MSTPLNYFAITIIVNVPGVEDQTACLENISAAIDVATTALADHPETGVVVTGQGGAFVFEDTAE